MPSRHMRPERVSIASRHRRSDRITGALRCPPQSQPRARHIRYPSQTIGCKHPLWCPAGCRGGRRPTGGTATINRRRQICAAPGSGSGHRCGVCAAPCARRPSTLRSMMGYLSFTSKFVHFESTSGVVVPSGERLAWMEQRVTSLLLTLAGQTRTRSKAKLMTYSCPQRAGRRSIGRLQQPGLLSRCLDHAAGRTWIQDENEP